MLPEKNEVPNSFDGTGVKCGKLFQEHFYHTRGLGSAKLFQKNTRLEALPAHHCAKTERRPLVCEPRWSCPLHLSASLLMLADGGR